MATSTTNYSFTLPEVGGDTDQWGTQLNNNWTLADSTIKTIEDSVVDVTLTGNDYLTISGQAITVGDVDLTADVTGTLPVGSGGTGLAAIGSADQVLGVNSGGTALEYKTLSTGGTVTSVAVTGADGIEIDSGSPITSSGTIALGINSTSLSTHLGLGSLATQSTITESQISDLGSYITASSTDTLTNKSGNISQWTNDSGYLTAETNNLSTVSGTLGTANGGTGLTAIGTANQVLAVNAGATALEFQTISITESQISDLQTYLTAETNDLSSVVTWANVPDANITESSVTQHQAALSITESQISDLGSYQTSDAGLTSIAGLTTAADKMLYTTAAETYAVTALTSAGRALLDDADAASQRTTLGLGTIATQAADSVNIDGGAIDGVTIGGTTPAAGYFTTLNTSNAVVFNDAGADVDFRVEGDTDSNLLFVNAGNDRVGIGTSLPSKKLTVNSDPDTTNPSNGAIISLNSPGLTVSEINSTSSGIGTNGMVTNFGGDFHIRSFWGVSIDKGAGNLGSGASNTVNADSRTFAIRQFAGGTTWNTQFSINGSGNCNISGSLSKGSGSFRINHPLKPDTHELVHSFIEGPQADLIYRGKVDLIEGLASVNIDTVAGMTQGTFVALNREIQCFTSNETGWTAVKGFVSGNILTITAQDETCTDTISWLVIGERQDQHMYDTDWTDENGKVIVEPEKTLED